MKKIMKKIVPTFEGFLNESKGDKKTLKKIEKIATKRGFKKISGDLTKYRPNEDNIKTLLFLASDKDNWIEIYSTPETDKPMGAHHKLYQKVESSDNTEWIEQYASADFYDDEFWFI